MSRPLISLLGVAAMFIASFSSTEAAPKKSTAGDEGIALLKAGNNKAAIAKLSEALKLDPKNSYLLNDRALAYSREKQFDRAMADFSAALRARPDWTIYYNGATAYADQGKSDAAIADFNKALKLAPQKPPDLTDILMARAHAYFDIQKAAPALQDLNAAIKLGVNDADPYILRGVLHKIEHDYARSLADYEKAIALEPSNDRSYDAEAYLLAVCPMPKFRDGKKAVAYATKACELTGWKQGGHLQAWPLLTPRVETSPPPRNGKKRRSRSIIPKPTKNGSISTSKSGRSAI